MDSLPSIRSALQPNKACPIVLRTVEHRVDLLAFIHPKAGKQIIKGTIEAGEGSTAAALRELYEESGIVAVRAVQTIGTWQAGLLGQIWSFTICEPTQPLPDHWEHFTTDGGGHIFTFFWQPLDEPLDEEWHPVFVGAVNYIRARLREIEDARQRTM